MSGQSSASRPFDCPLPPADLNSRTIPDRAFNVAANPLLRIHGTRFSARFFNRRSSSATVYRFDAPNDEYGVLYASPEFDACVAETLIRGRFQAGPLVLDESEIAERSISAIGVHGSPYLLLVDLTAPLFVIGGTTAITSVSDYRAPNSWSKAFYDHPKQYDGIYFFSRYANMPSVALFDRVDVTVEETTELVSDPRIADFLDRYQICLV